MKSQNKRPVWQFWVPMALQTVMIMAVPLQSAVIYTTGQPVTLKTLPVDPYDLLRGYSQTLRYEISDPKRLETLPGGKNILKDDFKANDADLYVVLQSSEIKADKVWEPVRVSRDRPKSLPNNQIAIKGQYKWRRIIYGLESYYIPEKQRKQINEEIREVQRDEERSFLVDIKINQQGESVPVSLWVGDREYRF